MRNYKSAFRLNLIFTVFLGIFILGDIQKTSAQEKTAGGKLEIIQDQRIDSLLKRQIILNKFKNTIPGFRVQIYSGQQRNKANEMKSEFLTIYPEVPSYLLYQQPNFKIRVGNFRSRLEAYKFMRSLAAAFSNSFIVNDEIVIPELGAK